MSLARGVAYRWALPATALVALTLTICDASSAPGPRSRPAGAAEQAPAREQATAAVACLTCHNVGETRSSQDHPFAKNGLESHKYILLSEGPTWQRRDPHSIAFKVLEGGTAKAMGERLNYADVTKAPQCLTCHATDTAPMPVAPPPGTPPPANRFSTDFGVSCTACHGTAREWQVNHYQESNGKMAWRELKPVAKAKQGLRDLRNPTVKALLCVSCHVGDAAEGKVVTHEMYAAGHPPLPPFEMSTYLLGQPRHWAHPTDARLAYFRDVAANDRWEQYRFHPGIEESDGESSVARDHVVGAIASLKAEAALIEAEAGRATRDRDLIDFARFDCYACHHDLKSPADRPGPGAGKPPGRPPLRASVGPPARVVARHAFAAEDSGLKGVAGNFETKWEFLNAAALSRPFGDPKKLEAAARELIAWCDAFLDYQRDCPTPLYAKSEATRLAEMIAQAVGAAPLADPELAMVWTWAYLNLARDLGSNPSDDVRKSLSLQVPLALREEPFAATDGPARIDFACRAKAIKTFEADPFRTAFERLRSKK